MMVRGVVISAAVVVLALGACSEPGTPVPVSETVTSAPGAPTPNPEQQRNLDLVERLRELGCATNSCIQTYFACMDGLLTGEVCEFYRQHPP